MSQFFWVGVGTEMTGGDVYEKHLSICILMEGINICLVILVGCEFNKIHMVTIDVANGEFGDN